MYQISALEKAFESKKALRDISLDLEKGQFVAVMDAGDRVAHRVFGRGAGANLRRRSDDFGEEPERGAVQAGHQEGSDLESLIQGLLDPSQGRGPFLIERTLAARAKARRRPSAIVIQGSHLCSACLSGVGTSGTEAMSREGSSTATPGAVFEFCAMGATRACFTRVGVSSGTTTSDSLSKEEIEKTFRSGFANETSERFSECAHAPKRKDAQIALRNKVTENPGCVEEGRVMRPPMEKSVGPSKARSGSSFP